MLKSAVRKLIRSLGYDLRRVSSYTVGEDQIPPGLYRKYRESTMVSEEIFWANLRLCRRFNHVPGCIVECGVWKGGMSGAIAEVLGAGRAYYLFDSFEGLPKAEAIDGEAALRWQADTASPGYFDNCRATDVDARAAMTQSGACEFYIVKGWFSTTLPQFNPKQPIAILRLDCDWYASIMDSLSCLYDKMATGGVIIVDDYYTWDGCSKALHDFLSQRKLPERIFQLAGGNCYLVKSG